MQVDIAPCNAIFIADAVPCIGPWVPPPDPAEQHPRLSLARSASSADTHHVAVWRSPEIKHFLIVHTLSCSVCCVPFRMCWPFAQSPEIVYGGVVERETSAPAFKLFLPTDSRPSDKTVTSSPQSGPPRHGPSSYMRGLLSHAGSTLFRL